MPRPGLALGRYPERQATKPDRLDELFGRAGAHVASRWESRASKSAQVVATINQTGQSFATLREDSLQAAIANLRPRLVYAAWDDDLAVQAFAAVREMSARILGMRHFESQVLGGWVMFHGKLAEMQTGEGKTLTATLPAATAAMAGVPVHVITSNDYLATRDAEQMRPLYEALGLTVSVVHEGMDFHARRAAYACDITYCTNKQVAFDYLRDRVERGSTSSKLHLNLEPMYDDPARCKGLMLRGLCYAIVDEADSVLIDEARTPLVLSRALDADEFMHATYKQALTFADNLTEGEDFQVRADERQVLITARGAARLAELSTQMSSIWNGPRWREETVNKALSAKHLFIRDRDYVVRDDKIQIVDGNTGRVMADRSWEQGLHQMIETKENCEISGNKETLARISYQRFFRRYLKLSGMTGTAREIERELGEVYGLNVVPIPPHRPSRRTAMPEHVYLRSEDAMAAAVASAGEHAARGRPVLIGTRSVLKSEQVAKLLAVAGLDAQVLNARQDADEANIIAQAGEAGRITVATNMAGRGTDIHLGPGVEDNGGLHVIVTERNDSARVDRQLVGRCARQGDPGSYQSFSSLEDDLVKLYFRPFIHDLLAQFSRGVPSQLPGWLGSRMLNLAQLSLQRRHKIARRLVDSEGERLADVLSFTGTSE